MLVNLPLPWWGLALSIRAKDTLLWIFSEVLGQWSKVREEQKQGSCKEEIPDCFSLSLNTMEAAGPAAPNFKGSVPPPLAWCCRRAPG